ncbi:MAG: aspartate racemase [Bacteroidetes bacterium 4484_276]|nr:MAG: aspartate racemase [Bacteroidetes bacterium 4484_276]
MKTLGLIGGTGWVSSIDYYRLINLEINKRLGGLQAAKLILYSINYGEIDAFNQKDDLESVYGLIKNAAVKLKSSGAGGLVLCANTTHMFAERLQQEIKLPLIHIGEATARAINDRGFQKVALLGTKFTMEMDFYKAKLNKYGIEMMVPAKDDRVFIHRAIMDELLKNDFRPKTKAKFLDIISNLIDDGAQGIVLGCTEIPLLVKPEDIDVPLFNTTEIHALAAVEFALGA